MTEKEKETIRKALDILRDLNGPYEIEDANTEVRYMLIKLLEDSE